MVNYPEIFNPRHLSDICHTRLRKPYLERVIFSEDGTSPAQVRVEFLVTDQQKFCKSSILNQAELVFIAGFIPGFFWPHFQNPTSNKNLSQRKSRAKDHASCVMFLLRLLQMYEFQHHKRHPKSPHFHVLVSSVVSSNLSMRNWEPSLPNPYQPLGCHCWPHLYSTHHDIFAHIFCDLNKKP